MNTDISNDQIKDISTIGDGFSRFPVSEFSLLGNAVIERKKIILNTGFDHLNCIKYRVDGTQLSFIYQNRTVEWRIDTLFEKEPHTLAWINRFNPSDYFVDVGANVGVYTIWAAVMRKVNVIAFEPDSQNYAVLNQNISANRLHRNNQVLAYCCAISNSIKFSQLHLTGCSAGLSFNDFDKRLEGRNTSFTQGCMSVSIDELVNSATIPCPDHIKIDVDGYEHLVIDGCKNTLESGLVKSVLIEIDRADANHLAMLEYMTRLGYRYDDAQVNGKRSIPIPSNATTRNYIFFKDEKYRV